jgi:hypothetical protein
MRPSVPDVLDLSAEDCNEARSLTHSGDKWFDMMTVKGKKAPKQRVVKAHYQLTNVEALHPDAIPAPHESLGPRCFIQWTPTKPTLLEVPG